MPDKTRRKAFCTVVIFGFAWLVIGVVRIARVSAIWASILPGTGVLNHLTKRKHNALKIKCGFQFPFNDKTVC